jgi:Rrf2 family nitric oxide-sensitive transcriptional repressor
MRLTRQTDYSLRLLIYLALAEGRLVTIAEVAENFQVSRNHLMKIANQLSNLGYLESLRGKGGGIRLARTPAQVRLGQLVRATEPPQPLVDCHNPPCPIAGNCGLVGVLNQAQLAFLASLDQYSLADVISNRDQLRVAFPGLS